MKKEMNLEGTCKEIVLMMQSVIDGDATEEEKRAVAEHVSYCDTCRRTMEDMMLIRRETAALAAEPPCDLKDRILKRVTEEDRSAAIRRVRRSKNRMRGITGTVAAAAVIALCVFGVTRYVRTRDIPVLGFAAMQDKAISADMAAPEAAEEEIMEVTNGTQAELMYSAAAPEEEAGVVYDRETILADAEELIAAHDVKGMYAEVFYANVASLPDIEALYKDPLGEVGIYETDDFAAFVTQNNVTVSGVQYEFTNGVEIASCGLEYGGAEVLIILVTR